jgi:hypothetical protein
MKPIPPVRGHLCDAAFWDIGTPADYRETNVAFRSEPPEQARQTRRVDATSTVAGFVLLG